MGVWYKSVNFGAGKRLISPFLDLNGLSTAKEIAAAKMHTVLVHVDAIALLARTFTSVMKGIITMMWCETTSIDLRLWLTGAVEWMEGSGQ